jgi:transposase
VQTIMKGKSIQRVEVTVGELEEILKRARSVLSPEDYEKLQAAVDTLEFLTQEIEGKNASIRRLRDLLFGPTSEKTAKVLEAIGEQSQAATPPPCGGTGEGAASPESPQGEKKKRNGHGRNGAEAFRGANKVKVSHESLKPGSPCPEEGCDGKVYLQNQPAKIVRFVGAAPIQAAVYEMERLRCNLCGKVFTAPMPQGVDEKRYDDTVASMIACLRYGSGFPLNRLANLQENLEIPLPAGTQWDIVKKMAELVAPAYEHLIDEAAQGEVFHNDDTPMKILELMQNRRSRDGPSEDPCGRKGVFTSGVVSRRKEQTIALFFTGNRHAGENLESVLARRAAELAAPIHMCDGLSRNLPGQLAVIVSNCLAHGRRRYVEAVERFPEECRFVLEILGKVYKVDETARSKGLSPKERLRLHQAESKPQMELLHEWLKQQFDEKKVEPNSGLGEAISYMLKRWERLTLFLRKPGAPLDNNICERALKKAILHRNNSLFYKTQNGARVGDIFMSLIHTAELAGANPFDYLTELQRHAEEAGKDPARWMPWNYKQTLQTITEAPQP